MPQEFSKQAHKYALRHKVALVRVTVWVSPNNHETYEGPLNHLPSRLAGHRVAIERGLIGDVVIEKPRYAIDPDVEQAMSEITPEHLQAWQDQFKKPRYEKAEQ